MNIKQKLRTQNLSIYIGLIVGIAIGAIGIYFISIHLAMNDAYWHIKTGEWVSQFGVVDRCYGSWMLEKDSWMAHEWLFGWIIYQVSRLGMNSIVRMFCILYLLTVFVCLYQTGILSRNEKPPMLYWELVLFLQFSIFALGMTARPQYMSAFLIAMFLFILNKSIQGNEKILYVLPFLTVFWANVHGGTSLLSYITIFVYLLCNIMNWDIGKIHFQRAEKSWMIHCVIVLLLTVCAILVNPYGYQMLFYPYTNMQDSFMVSQIAEWASPDAKNIVTLLFQIMPMLLGMIALIQYQGVIKAHDVAIFFLYLILYLRSARFYPFLVVVQTCLIAPYAFQLSNPIQTRKRDKKTVSRFGNNISLLLIGCVCIGYILYTLCTVDMNRIEKNKELPDNLVNQICRDKPERLLNHYNVGGYLLYHGVDVFVDGRYEPYNRNHIICDYAMLMYPSNIKEYEQMTSIMDKYDFDAFLIST